MKKEFASKTLEVPKNVDIRVDEKIVSVKGSKGELSRDFGNPKYNKSVLLEKKDGLIEIKFENSKEFRAIAGTIIAHIKNMSLGVTEGFQYRMKIIYSHFPVSVAVKDNELHVKNFLGEKGARIAKITKGCSVKVDKEEIALTGVDVEALGQTAQRIEQICRLSGRDRRVFQDGIYLTGRYLQSGKPL